MIEKQRGFTLIELLVVIFILGILATLIVSNMQGARQRARDTVKKSELSNLKTALRLYYNDYQKYPPNNSPVGYKFKACGPDGEQVCPAGCEADFAAGGVGGCDTTYMKNLTEDGSNFIFRYYYCSDDDFRLKVDLENLSDAEITTSQDRCPSSSCTGSPGISFTSEEYILCAD